MNLEKVLQERSQHSCELCKSTVNLTIYTVQPSVKVNISDSIYACETCISQIENSDLLNPNYWRCLNDSMWSEHLPVQVMAWRMLNRVLSAGWSQGLLDMMYLDEEPLEWAKALGDGVEEANKVVHRDVNGVVLQAGDNVVLIKDLKVKGSSMIAKQGTAVRRISLDHENETYIEGKIDGKQIVIITQFVKKL
ncbi:MAG: PhnA domain-containing protein [Flavobacteriaceae bacterium]|jgi:protein PhnA|nr:PhnA protein [Formosa sp.]MDG1374869.1 PhnA domain-containing protein [Flavobacteriaceae bacterium]MDG2498212.1 PhnA domain-containing protein [Flavobacteriaceae bacterium]